MINFEQIQLDFRAKIPLYIQLSSQLRQQIENGALQAEDQLPPVRSLAERLRVNFNTVARAYRILDIEGWISTQQGRGTYITTQTWPRAIAPGAQLAAAPLETDPQEQVQPLPVLPAHDELQGALAPTGQPPEEPETQVIARMEIPATETPQIDQANRRRLIEELLAQAATLGISSAELCAYLENQAQKPGADLQPAARQEHGRLNRKDNRRRRVKIKGAAAEKALNLPVSTLPDTPQHARTKKRNPGL